MVHGLSTNCSTTVHNIFVDFFQSMRSSCENDWKEQGFAEATYCAWIGHDPKVSRKHYVSPTEAEYAQVTKVA